MGVYRVPSYMKPKIAVSTWTLNYGFDEEYRREFILDDTNIVPCIRREIQKYRKFDRLVLKTDLRGNAIEFKLRPNPQDVVLEPIEAFVEMVTDGKVIGEVQGRFNMLDESSEKLVAEVFAALDSYDRSVIALPMQWLVYHPESKTLTRLCWVLELNGKIRIRPYGANGILLEVTEVKLDRINSLSLFALRDHRMKKEHVNDKWRQLVISETAPELVEGFDMGTTITEESSPEVEVE